MGTTGNVDSSNIANILQSMNYRPIDHTAIHQYASLERSRRSSQPEFMISIGIVAVAVVLLSMFSTRRRTRVLKNVSAPKRDNRVEEV